MLRAQKKQSSSPLDRGDGPSIFEDNVGRRLRKSRESYGQDLRRVAEALRIRYVYLDAIEKGHHDRMPGAAYAVGFVRSYAEFLGMDGEEIVNQYKREISGVGHDQNLHFPTPSPESKVPGGAVFLICALIGLLAYGTWYYLSSREASVVDLIPALPDRLQALVSEDAPGDTTAAGAAIDSTEPGGATPVEATSPENAVVSAAPDGTATDETAPDETALDDAVQPAAENSTGVSPSATGSDAPSAPSLGEPTLSSDSDLAVGSADDSDPVQTAAAPEQATPLEFDATALPDAPPPPPVLSATPESGVASPAIATGTSTGVTLGNVTEALDLTPPNVTEESAIPGIPEPASPQTLAALGADQTQGELFGAENSDAKVVLKATMDCWVQVRDSQGVLLLTQVLRPGDRYLVPDQPGLTLMMGNAGGLEIIVENVVLPPFGPVGAVRRNIVLEPQALIAQAAGL